MITLKELSQILGVSTATVSNALKGKGRMSAAKRLEIIETATAKGYDVQSALLRQHTKNVYVLVEQLDIVFLTRAIEQICLAAQALDINVYICNLNMVTRLKTIYPDTEQLRELIRPTFHNILSVASGIIYLSQYPRDLTGIFPKTSIPVVIAFGISKDAIPCVNYDDAHGAYLATEHLIQAGCRRIAMISGPINSISMTKRLSGYTRALLDGGIDFDPKLIQLSDWMKDSGYLCAKMLLNQEPPPDGFFCQNDSMAVGAMKAVRELGLCVPDDIAIVGFDDDRFGALIEPSLTSIAPPFEQIGQKAFECLLNKMNKAPISGNWKLKCKLIPRSSSQRKRTS